MKYSKIWGLTKSLLDNPNFELHRIDIKKGGYCSKHYHKNKHNYFYVVSGILQIDVFREDSDKKIVDSTILGPDESTSVPPTCIHKFIALEDTIAFELYWTTNQTYLEKDDIVRFDQGGVL
jgi:mannose-6-phosphate isomerase-like protein (cupin superfamily)